MITTTEKRIFFKDVCVLLICAMCVCHVVCVQYTYIYTNQQTIKLKTFLLLVVMNRKYKIKKMIRKKKQSTLVRRNKTKKIKICACPHQDRSSPRSCIPSFLERLPWTSTPGKEAYTHTAFELD